LRKRGRAPAIAIIRGLKKRLDVAGLDHAGEKEKGKKKRGKSSVFVDAA